MIDLITGHQGMPHISAPQIAALNNAVIENYGEGKLLRMKNGTMSLSGRVLTINTGYWRANGYDMEIQQTETMEIDLATLWDRRDGLYVEILRDIPTGAERAEIVRVKGNPAASPVEPPAPTEPELTTDTLIMAQNIGALYVTALGVTLEDRTMEYHLNNLGLSIVDGKLCITYTR